MVEEGGWWTDPGWWGLDGRGSKTAALLIGAAGLPLFLVGVLLVPAVAESARWAGGIKRSDARDRCSGAGSLGYVSSAGAVSICSG